MVIYVWVPILDGHRTCTAWVMAMTWAWGFELSGIGVCMLEQQFGDSATGQRGGSLVTWLKIG